MRYLLSAMRKVNAQIRRAGGCKRPIETSKVSVSSSSVKSETNGPGKRPRTLAKKPCLTYIEIMIKYRIIKQTMTNHFEIMAYTF